MRCLETWKEKNKLYTLHWEDAQGNKYTGSPSCNSTTKLGPGDDLIWNERASVQYIYAHCMPSFRINYNNDSWTLNCLFRNCCKILSQTQFPTKFVQRLPYIEYVMYLTCKFFCSADFAVNTVPPHMSQDILFNFVSPFSHNNELNEF